MASIGIGAIGEPAVSNLIEPALTGWLNHALATVISVALAYLLITGIQVVLGELVPKLVAIRHAEGVAMRGARPLQFFRHIFLPFSSVLTAISNWIHVNRASSNPEIISTFHPVVDRTHSRKARELRASRRALVATTRTESAPSCCTANENGGAP